MRTVAASLPRTGRAVSPAARVAALGRRHPLAPIALGVVLYSTGSVFVAASDVSGAVFSFGRLWLGVIVFAIAVAVQARRGEVEPMAPGVRRLAVLAGVAFGLHQLAMFTAVKLTSVVDVTLIGSLSPIVTAVLAIPFFDERPGPAFRVWSLVAMAGSAVVVATGGSGPEGDLVGMALAGAHVTLFAAFFLLSKATRGRIGTLPFLLRVMATAAVLVSAYVWVLGEPVGSASGRDWVLMACVAAGPGFLGHVVMTWPLAWVPANVPPVMRLAMPVLSGFLAWVLLGQGIGWGHVGGGALVLAGVAGAILSRAGRELVAAERTSPPEADAVGTRTSV